jgi:hypothetical protein
MGALRVIEMIRTAPPPETLKKRAPLQRRSAATLQ